jgi:hypothetical protein
VPAPPPTLPSLTQPMLSNVSEFKTARSPLAPRGQLLDEIDERGDDEAAGVEAPGGDVLDEDRDRGARR